MNNLIKKFGISALISMIVAMCITLLYLFDKTVPIKAENISTKQGNTIELGYHPNEIVESVDNREVLQPVNIMVTEVVSQSSVEVKSSTEESTVITTEYRRKESKTDNKHKIVEENTTYAVIDEAYPGYMTKYMDLRCRQNITTDQINTIIDNYCSNNSELKNTGAAFIKASKITGLDPIFLLCLAAQEAGWEVSDLHSSRNNPYSINMVDTNPRAGYTMGNDFSDGIINGAIWIKENYYDKGQYCLYLMIYGDKQYSSAADEWINSICSNMQKCYNML